MTLFEYKCDFCNNIFDKFVSNKDRDNLVECPKCEKVKGKRISIPSGLGINFKGGGFYCNGG